METELIYEEPQPITEKEVFEAIANDDVEKLMMIPIELGFHHDNWRFIQDISVRLSEHADFRVRANALFGIEYAARFKGKVEKNIVKPVLLRALKDPNQEVSERAEDTIAEVNHLMGWSIGGAARQKMRQKRFETAGWSEQPTTSSDRAESGLEVVHTAISIEEVPADILDNMDYPYVWFYRTDVINHTGKPIRIVWFEGYSEQDGIWYANNICHKVLRNHDFCEWYNEGDKFADGWLKPGEVATCRVNWDCSETPEKVPVKWCYIGVDSEGNDYFAEAIVPEIEPIVREP